MKRPRARSLDNLKNLQKTLSGYPGPGFRKKQNQFLKVTRGLRGFSTNTRRYRIKCTNSPKHSAKHRFREDQKGYQTKNRKSRTTISATSSKPTTEGAHDHQMSSLTSTDTAKQTTTCIIHPRKSSQELATSHPLSLFQSGRPRHSHLQTTLTEPSTPSQVVTRARHFHLPSSSLNPDGNDTRTT